ncbi:MAG: trigger factor [Anaerovoracaceae bacterium]|nr:trigger factor [Anaerovoracaceae bacterium]
MKKKAAASFICLMMVFGLASCGSSVSYDSYDLGEYLKVGEYKGLPVSDYTVSVTDDEVQTQIQSTLEAAATTQELDKETALADGDTVNIDYVGTIDGKEFDGGSAEGYDLTLGSGSFIDGFESGLVGKHVGDTTDLELTFPDDYSSEDLQGKDVVFNVTINSATRQEVPEYSLDFVQNTTDFDTLEEYEADVEKQLYEQKEQTEIDNQKTTLWSELLEDTEVKEYPEDILNYYIDFNSSQMDTMAEEYGMSRDELLASYDFGDEDEFAAVNEDSSKLRVKQEMLIEYLAEKEGLSYTDKEKEEAIKAYEDAGYDDKSIELQTGRNMEDYVHIELLYQKVLDYLLDNAKITEAADDEASE